MSAAETTISDPTVLTGEYAFDPAHTTFGFVARHAMVTKVRGTFAEFEGSAHLDFADPSKSTVTVTIKAASINTGHPDRDAHLRSNDFFAMDEHPEITFNSTAIEPVVAALCMTSADPSVARRRGGSAARAGRGPPFPA